MVDPSLAGALAKFHRARERFDEISGLIEGFREPDDPYRIMKHQWHDGIKTETISYRAHIDRGPPILDWSPVIGELLYGARSSLDHLAYQLAVVHCHPHEPPRGIRFPIFASEKKFFEKRRDGTFAHGSGAHQFRAMSSDAQTIIVELQPYARRKNPEHDPLWVLHQLGNQDKHETLPLIWSGAESKVTIVSQQDMKIRVRAKRYGPIKDGTEIVRVVGTATGPEPDMQVQVEAWLSEAFDEIGAALGHTILRQLRDILDTISQDVFPRFTKFFP